MPTWGELLKEVNDLREEGEQSPFDKVRRKYLAQLHDYTGRNVILYASAWTLTKNVPPEMVSITEEDIQGFMEVVHGLEGDTLDLIVHSPGGSAEATEPIVKYLRSKFDDIRVLIPHAAMSAATMLACGGNRIVMGRYSSIGPIDPQLVLNTPQQPGVQLVPAQTILDQFRMAQAECRDEELFSSWIPILPQYGPALLVQARNAIDLSTELVSSWLASYMFAGLEDARERAEAVAAKLVDFSAFKSHGRHIDGEQARDIGLVVEDLEADQELQDLVLTVYNATALTLDGTNAVKITENHLGKAFVKQVQTVVVAQTMRPGGPPGPPGGPMGGPGEPDHSESPGRTP